MNIFGSRLGNRFQTERADNEVQYALKNVKMEDLSEVEFLKGDCLFLSFVELVRSLQRD